MEFIVSQVLHVIKVILQTVAVQFKKKKHILIAFILVNLFAAIGYMLLKAYSGLIIGLIAVIQTAIQYIFDKKNKNVPKVIIALYFISSIIGGIYTYKTLIDILPVLSFIMYIMSIIQKKESKVRLFTFIKLILWIPYDLYNLAIASCIGRIITLVSTIVGIMRLDRKKVLKSK